MADKTALLQKVEELTRNNQHQRAIALLQKGMRQLNGDPEVAHRLARSLEVVKKYEQALNLYQQLAKPHGENIPGILALGLARCLTAIKQYDSALRLYEPMHKNAPNNVEVLIGLASCRRNKSRLPEAETLISKALKLQPDNKLAHHELAQIKIAEKATDEAIKALEFNVCREDLHGDSLDLWMDLLRTSNRTRYMQEQLEALTTKYPKKVEFAFGFAVAANRAGEFTLARPAFERSLKLLPDSHKILYEFGVMERVAGNIEKSQSLILRSLELNPEQPAGLRTYGVDHKYQYGDTQFNRLNMVAAGITDMKPMEQIQIHFGLAKAFDDVGELDAAFRHYAIGGAKKRKEDPYRERDSERMFKLMTQIVCRQRFDADKQRGCESELPVFVLGMPRSGTSLLEQILSSHPDIFGAGELKLMTSVLDNIGFSQARLKLGDPEPTFPYEDDASWATRGQRYVDRLAKLAPKKYARVVDKMPGNFNYVGLIHAVMPKARIIHSRRHPVETCLSIYRILFAEGHPWSYDLGNLGRYYRRYWNLMKHWRTEFPGVMYEVRYEDNVADVEGEARKLIEYLGLPWNDNCLNFYNNDRPVKTASASQVRKPIYTTSTNRWRKYEKYLGPLLEEIGDIVAEYEAEIAHLTPKA